jgi:hypothetical protein
VGRIDFNAVVLGPVYDTFAKPAVLTIGPASCDVEVIDNIKGVSVEEGGLVGVQTIRPAVAVRRTTLLLNGIKFDDLVDGQLALDGVAWRIKSFIESPGELRLILMQDD